MDKGGKSALLPTYNGQSYTFTWENGRQLARAVVGGQTLTYKYNVDGIRTEKTLLGEYTDTYRLNGTQVVEMSRDGSDGTYRLVFVYDENGSPLCFDLYSGSNTTSVRYYYVTNLQGDVVRLINSNNATVADYTYDAWGKLLSVTDANGNAITSEYHIANLNPLRYRGYFYDIETGLYYCNSRYYDPQVRRFINADDFDVLHATPGQFTDKNLFAYCDNNPVLREDNGGEFWDIVLDVVSLAISIVDVAKNPKSPTAWGGLAADVVSLAVPFATGGGAIVKAATKADDVVDVVKAANKVDDVVDTTKTAKKAVKVHGNSLKSTKTNYGYALVDRENNIMKFGETVNPRTRYSQKYLNQNGYTMKVLESGSKADIHHWQYDMNMYYKSRYGSFPPLNKKGW